MFLSSYAIYFLELFENWRVKKLLAPGWLNNFSDAILYVVMTRRDKLAALLNNRFALQKQIPNAIKSETTCSFLQILISTTHPKVNNLVDSTYALTRKFANVGSGNGNRSAKDRS